MAGVRSGVPIFLFLTKDDELRMHLADDAPACLAQLEIVLGQPVGSEPGGDGPIGDPSRVSAEQLHARVIGSITRAFERRGRFVTSCVLDATNVSAARAALDGAVMLTLVAFAKSGRGNRPDPHANPWASSLPNAAECTSSLGSLV